MTKRVQEFEKTFDFVNSHLLKGVATMAELTKLDSRQPMGKIKPTDKMAMMLSLFDGTKPATSKQHYERFNLFIIFKKHIAINAIINGKNKRYECINDYIDDMSDATKIVVINTVSDISQAPSLNKLHFLLFPFDDPI